MEEDHPERGIVPAEVEEALRDPERLESAEVRQNVTYHTVIGSNGRFMKSILDAAVSRLERRRESKPSARRTGSGR